MSSGIGTTQSAIAIGFSFPIIGGTLVALRFFSRWYLETKRLADDWLCLPAWLCLTGSCASLLVGVFNNAFPAAEPSDPSTAAEQHRVLAQITAALVIFWMFSVTLTKLSILIFYRRVFKGRNFNIFTWILIALCLLWLVYAFLAWLFYCGTDFEANFEGGWLACPSWGFEIQLGVFPLDNFIDLSILVLPIPFVWRLQLSMSKKIIVGFIFLLGGLAFVAGLNNTIIQSIYITQPNFAETSEGSSFFQGPCLIFSWPVIEAGVGLIACNLPSLSCRVATAIPKQIQRRWGPFMSSFHYGASRPFVRTSGSTDHKNAAIVDHGVSLTHDENTRWWVGHPNGHDGFSMAIAAEDGRAGPRHLPHGYTGNYSYCH